MADDVGPGGYYYAGSRIVALSAGEVACVDFGDGRIFCFQLEPRADCVIVTGSPASGDRRGFAAHVPVLSILPAGPNVAHLTMGLMRRSDGKFEIAPGAPAACRRVLRRVSGAADTLVNSETLRFVTGAGLSLLVSTRSLVRGNQGSVDHSDTGYVSLFTETSVDATSPLVLSPRPAITSLHLGLVAPNQILVYLRAETLG